MKIKLNLTTRLSSCLLCILLGTITHPVHALPWEESYPNFTFNCCGETTLTGEALYWTPCSDGYFFTIERVGEVFASAGGEPITVTVFGSNFRYKIHKASDNANAGWRLGVSYLCPASYWEASLHWLHYCAENSRHFSNEEPKFIPFSTFRPSRDGFAFSQRSGIFPDLLAETLKGKWEMTLDIVDIAFGYPTNWCESIDLRPHMDLRFLLLEQKLKIDATGDIVDLFGEVFGAEEPGGGTFLADFNSHETLNLKNWAIGPRFAIDLDWEINCGFGLYGMIGGSIVYGDHKSRAELKLERFNTAIEPLPANGDVLPVDLELSQRRHGARWCSRAILDIGLGLSWHLAPCECPFALIVKVGWEQHQFYNLGMGNVDAAARGYVSREGNDLSTQGLNLSFNMIF